MRAFVSVKPALVPVGIVGTGRSRGGLGPFLAKFVEQEGFFVTGVSGRSLGRATANAQTIGQQLGHEVTPFASPAALCATGLGAVVIASPAEFHLEALQAATEAGLPTLCEKPLVHESHGKEGAEVIEAFARRRLPLLENCQWPNVLPAFSQLHGGVQIGEQLKVELGLGTPRYGREMVQNTVSHLLSIVQAVAPLDSRAVVADVRVANPSYEKKHNLLQFRLVSPGKTVEALLHLEVCAVGTRPAWLAINNRRIDRDVGRGYSIAFSANGMKVAIEDPIKKLVNQFARLVRSRDSVVIDHERHRIRQRLHWYRQILNQLE